jgi:cytidylate kinase
MLPIVAARDSPFPLRMSLVALELRGMVEEARKGAVQGFAMTERTPSLHVNEERLTPAVGQSPLHGFRGQPESGDVPGMPAALTIAISREAGARGAAIARRAGAKLGWQVYSQDLLEYICHAGTFQDILADLPPAAAAWVEEHSHRLQQSGHPTLLELARMILALGAQGEVVLLGRGAGCILPPRTTLHVRLVAPLADRIAYVSQWMRLTEEEAAEQVRKSDERRAEFIQSHFQRQPSDVHQYDLVLNTSLLGEERCAELIVYAAHAKAPAG